MSKTLARFLLLLSFFLCLDCELYQNRPKIRTSDGDLILEAAFDKNIYLLPNGPKSRVYVGEVNILDRDASNSGGQRVPATNEDVTPYLNGPDGILQRLQRLEEKTSSVSNELSLNISLAWRNINRLNRRVTRLQVQLQHYRNDDDCHSQPCQHAGTCLNLVNGYHCLCPPNWEGKDCDIDVNECRNFAGTDLGCQNGATCLNTPGSYVCLCRSGWYGLHCTRKEKDCSGGDFEMCGHGTCVATTAGDGVRCICHQGWTTNGTSAACLTDINECEEGQGARCSVNPKVTCINLPGSFRCGQCPPGYEGDGYSCSDINECVTIPNGGCSPMVTCHNTVGSRICGSCPPSYQGDGITCTWRGSCNINHGGCHPSAQCIENIGMGGSQCICPEGTEGDGVGIQGCVISTGGNYSEPCMNNPCGTHGQCHALRVGYTCICYRGYSGAHCDVISNLCAVNPCHNGGVCRLDQTITRGYRCECTSQYTGPLCQMPLRSCGGVLDNEEGSIVYPAANTTYSHNSRCAWVIHTIPDKVINITFSKFNLEGGADCNWDFLQIHDGRSSASQLIGRFCGNEFPKGGNIISSHNNLYFWFRSDSTVAKTGFALHWTSIKPVCGGEVDASVHGQISSPGSPGKYPPNRDCYWHLTTTLGKRIQLHFFGLDIEAHNNCSHDYLEIFDGERSTDPLLNRYCNSTQPAPIHSAGSELLIHFHSDAFGSGNGFQIAFAPTEGVPGCGGYFTTEKGEIFSPSFNGSYLDNLLCEYKIKTSPDTRIKIDFKSFKLERSFKCKFDYLKIYDGPSANSQLVGKFCGVTFPQSYTSTSNTLFFIFKSDRSMSSEGFRITFKAVCQLTVQGDSGIIKSPGYPFNYPEDRVCEYVIRAAPGKSIQLKFQDFDIEDNNYYNCQYDHVEIRDGPNVNSTLLGSYCGGPEHTPPVQTSTHNYMYVKFVSDISVSGSGFYANYTTIDAECGGIYHDTTGLINHPSKSNENYKNDQKCTWLLIAPEGLHIKLTWNRFDLETMMDCGSDYVELIEIDENNENNLMGKFCGTKAPPALTSSTNRLMIKFTSDSSIGSSGFSVSYTFLDEKTHCGGMYIKTHGYIYSPGYPKHYEPNRDCAWIIEVPAGQQIKLNISEFDLERPIRNKCNLGDYLELRNGGTDTSPLIGQFCGKFKSRIITSMTNVLYLHFHSDFYLTGQGFKIEWDGSITGCGGTLTSSTGSITSPNYPNNYNENAECFYKIVVNPGSIIRISFRELDLERTYMCKDDYVEIFDGRDSTANSLGKYCAMSPALSNIVTSSNYAFIKFRSDFYLSRKGFHLDYNSVCQNNITGRYGVIESPDYPNNSPQHLDCLWNIIAPKGNKINVTFTYFNIKKTHHHPYWVSRNTHFRTCDSDYLQTKELSETEFSSKLCGNIPHYTITTKTNALQIKYATGSFPQPGFRLEWVSYGCGGHIQKNSGVLVLDRALTSAGEMECEWLLETSVGRAVSIGFNNLFMTDNTNCTMDAIEIYNGKDIASPLLSRICHVTKSWIESTDNYMLVRFIKRSTLRDAFINARFFSLTAKCGGFRQSFSGFIYSKNYPKNYDNNLDCTWTIGVPRNHRIEFSLIDLDLYSSRSVYEEADDDSSCGDYIKIYDERNSNYTNKICPNSNITKVITRNNKAYVQFVTNNYGTAKGFKIGFNTICGAVISAINDGVIANEINSYTSSCTWTIIAQKPDQKISLTITHMSLQPIFNQTCQSSFIRVYDGDDKLAPLINEYCGRKIPPMIVSAGSAITVELGTYGNNIEGHFSAHYTPLSNACGGTLTSEEGTIASPNYPRPYPADAHCEWILKTSPGNKVYITFERFDLEESEGCNEDYLEVREDFGGGKLLGVYCGNNIPTNTTVATKLYIKFHSDIRNNGGGFLIHYGFLHGNEIYGDRGEVASPLYPHLYHGTAEYSWRIETIGTKEISISVDDMEIRSYGDMCYNKLSIYDGYDESANLLKEFCGILGPTPKVLQTSSNAVYIKLFLDESNTGSMFHLTWANTDKGDEEEEDKINCGFNQTEIISPGTSKIFTSPNYPDEYSNELYCEWLFKSSPGYHLSLNFDDFHLEETSGCFADYVTIYAADTFGEWKLLKNKVCLGESVSERAIGSNYLKVIFKTDPTITNKGFKGIVTSLCGGIISDLSGTIGPRWVDMLPSNDVILKIENRCDWLIKVRPGRVIKLHFQQFNISNSATDCQVALILHNGESINSPLLGSGKFCGYEHEKRDDLITSSNAVLISYVSHFRRPLVLYSFRLHYEEQNVQCGVTTTLDIDHGWEIINSPNYPSIPLPYSECIWVINGPPGEILRIDFIDRFDLDNVDDCAMEVVEIHDGSSEFSPRLGRFCSERPGTVKTTNNVAYIKYTTQLAEPRNGFKANVSIDICGGTIVSNAGEITSPSYPHMKTLSYGSVCEWRIVGPSINILLLKPLDIDLPESETSCGTKVTIEELIPANNTITILKTICNDDNDSNFPAIESSTNEVMIKLHIGKPSEWTQLSESRGFRIKFNSSKPMCGGRISTSEGFLTTPSYPMETTLSFCQWHIKVPDKSRSVRLEILDADSQNHRIGIFNDLDFLSAIQRIPDDGDITSSNNVFESSGNTMGIYVWLSHLKSRHRFKAKFSSDSPALCGGEINGLNGSLVSPDLQRSYTCKWHYNSKAITADDGLQYDSIYVSVQLNSSVARTRCRYYDPKLNIKSNYLGQSQGLVFTRDLCGNSAESYRIPSAAIDLKATKSKTSSFYFNLEWKAQPCGGIVRVTTTVDNILKVPNNYTETLDCAWVVVVPDDNRIELKMEGSFQLECDDEYIKIYQGISKVSTLMGDFCKTQLMNDPIITNIRHIFVEYHSNVKPNTSIQITARTISDQCGGLLLSYQNIFTSPNFPKNYYANQECTWEIKANWGNRVSLNFIERFVIESADNCTKDAVIIYDWKDDQYIEVARLCGRLLPHAYNSTFNRMKVVLRTNADVNLDGFKAAWSPICGGNYIATEKEQILYSPNYPYDYSSLLDCTYEISGGDQKVTVKFLEFELEGNYPECEYDNVTLTVNGMNYFYGVYCDNELPPMLSGDSISLYFKTDRYQQYNGFKLWYKLYSCGGHVNTSTVITSNEFENYHENLNCTWIIEAPANKIVVLKFLYIDIEDSSDCTNDFLVVYDGLTKDAYNRLALLCGNMSTSATVLRSSGSALILQFITDSSYQSKGFKAEVFFTYSASVGCGGKINLTTSSTYTLKSPLMGHNVVYENYLDCQWSIRSPVDTYVKIKFQSFHIAPCKNVENQTAIGFSKCDCDFVQVLDGLNPNSLIIGTYCGHSLPLQLVSSDNTMSVRMVSDGEINSSGFEAHITVQRSICGRTSYPISNKVEQVKSPGYDSGSVPRGLHCAYQFVSAYDYVYYVVRVRVTVDLQAPENNDVEKNLCVKDKLLIAGVPNKVNTTLGQDFILQGQTNDVFYVNNFYDVTYPREIVLCGLKESTDFYVYGNIYINLVTSAETDNLNHRGVLIEVSYPGNCARNYTEPQGIIKSNYAESYDSNAPKDCYTLITAPENHTISLYFISASQNYWGQESFLEIFDGNNTNAPQLIKITTEYSNPVFSSGRYILLHNHDSDVDSSYTAHMNYDLVYMTTDKGKGCGGRLMNIIGKVTSPLYPRVYRNVNTCVWELETPSNTRLFLRFEEFDMSIKCDENYLQLVNRKGVVISTFCSETPADYTSDDNFVKLVFVTTLNNGGTGWVANFVGVV
ncbi:hypothetical protein O3G_MSEX008219 [Manduca sexta]|uniref:Cubilin n=1 Tax=Manduca sexta TaxID=7130 RepID=A0A922CPK4_MANSE|nr:hypothetical protein O3G_MSEX008219 [Manduca sexta]